MKVKPSRYPVPRFARLNSSSNSKPLRLTARVLIQYFALSLFLTLVIVLLCGFRSRHRKFETAAALRDIEEVRIGASPQILDQTAVAIISNRFRCFSNV